jgi:hypothetical protein
LSFPVEERRLVTVPDGIEVPMKALYRPDIKKVISTVGEDYPLVPHKIVVEKMIKAIPTELKFSRLTLCKDGAVMFARFDAPKIQRTEVAVGDLVSFGLEIFNSHDRSLELGFMFDARVLSCSNGATIPKSIARMGWRHSGREVFDKVKRDYEKRVPLFMQTIKIWKDWSRTKPSTSKVDAFFEAHIKPRNRDLLRSRYEEGKNKTLWGLFNVLTYYNTHEIQTRSGYEQNRRLRQLKFEQDEINPFYNFKWN